MSLPGPHSAGRILEWRNNVLVEREARPPIHDVLLVAFWPFWARRLRATLRATFGASLNVRLATSLGGLFDEVGNATPDIILLGVKADRDDLARQTIQALRQFGSTSPILVVGEFRRPSKIGLGTLDGVAVIHADDVCSGSLAEGFHKAQLGTRDCRTVS